VQAAVKFLLGDVYIQSDGTEIRYGADRWPGISYLRAHKIDFKPEGKMELSTWETGLIFPNYRMTINYKIPEWNEPDDSDNTQPEDVTFVTQELDFSVEILTVPMKTSSGKTVDRHVRIPTITYVATLPKVRVPNWSLIQSLVGKVNSGIIFGGSSETVLFDGPRFNREVRLLGDLSWSATYSFIYNPNGWNKTLNPDTLAWETVTAKTGGTKPYSTGNLNQLLA